jgi:hypothetical protein
MAMVMMRFVAMLQLVSVFQVQFASCQKGIQLSLHINRSWQYVVGWGKGTYRLTMPLSVLILRSV